MRSLHLKVFAPDFNPVFDDYIKHFDSCYSHTIIYYEDRISNKNLIAELTEHVQTINVLPGRIEIWYSSGAHLELTKC